MHIVHAMASGARGGGADHLLALLPALLAHGITVSAVVGDDGPLADQLQALGILARAYPLMGHRLDIRAARRIVGSAVQQGAQALHVHGTRAGVLATLGSALTSQAVPRIYSAHGLAHRLGRSAVHQHLRLLGERAACWGTAGVVSVSQADLSLLRDRGYVAHKRSFHIPNVVRLPADLTPQHLASARLTEARAAEGLPPDAQVVGTVSRLVAQKNVGALADAVMLLPESHLVVIGEGPDRPALQRHPLALAGRLHLWGARDDVPALLPLFDIFALSSRWEGEPIALLEAMAMGLPWVATQTAGAQEIATACGCGTLVAQNEPEMLAQALRTLQHDAALRHRHSQTGIAAMAARRPAQLAAQMAAMYAQVLL